MNHSTNTIVKYLVVTAVVTLGSAVNPVAAEQDARQGDFAEGARQWAENCTRCHNVRDPREMRDDQWKTTVYHMRVRAGLTGQQTRDILEFMQGSN